jgi:hypothetical protein
METQLNWKSRLFRGLCEIYEYGKLAGELKSAGWRQTLTGELKGEKFLFEVKGFWKKEILIRNAVDSSLAGQIVLSRWRTKAMISCRNQEYRWQFDNFFRTKWSISCDSGPLVKYQRHFKSGEITSYVKDELLILAGLFIRDYLRQRAAVAAASV